MQHGLLPLPRISGKFSLLSNKGGGLHLSYSVPPKKGGLRLYKEDDLTAGLDGLGGADRKRGGIGSHRTGHRGDDVLEGTESRDVIIPYDGSDTVDAKGGNEEVRHSFGNDIIKGGPGNDTLRGGRGNDTIYGGPRRDLIDCAYLETRTGDDGDTAYYTPSEGDRVVDCKTVIDSDPTNPNDPKLR